MRETPRDNGPEHRPGYDTELPAPARARSEKVLTVNRIFLTLSIVSNLGLAVAFGFGLSIGDPSQADAILRRSVSLHLLTALGAALLALLVHAVALTYFMGTGRWIEETCEAYRLGPDPRARNIRLKYRAIPGMIVCILLIMTTGAFGAMSDPGAERSASWSSQIHFLLACLTLGGNVLSSWLEWSAIADNGRLVDSVVQEVKRIRTSRGLDS